MKRLRRERQNRGWSQAELARQAQVHPTTVSLIESGRFAPGQSQLVKLARALDYPGEPAQLVEDEEKGA